MSCGPPAPDCNEQRSEGASMRIIGLDIHRAFAEAVAWEDGKLGLAASTCGANC